ncbi:MAG: hypothetical protein ACT4OX_09995 [Actinomycetota bacterium]
MRNRPDFCPDLEGGGQAPPQGDGDAPESARLVAQQHFVYLAREGAASEMATDPVAISRLGRC